METELSNIIAVVGGVVITLLLAYLPGLKAWWESTTGDQKRAVLAISYLLVSAGLYVPSCFGGPQIVACDTSQIWDVVMAFFFALMASQGAYTVLPTRKKIEMSSAPVPEVAMVE